mgnify:CR=1 FL=1
MGDINIVDILKLGLPGLAFLLSLLSYHLLTKEQEKTSPSARMLKSIRQFMYVNIFLAVLTIAAPIIDKYSGGSPGMDILSVAAKAVGENLGKGNAAVCTSVSYANRHLLIKDITTGRAIQVFARSVIPCASGIHISLTPEDATNLGWPKGEISSIVEVVPAALGQMFIL